MEKSQIYLKGSFWKRLLAFIVDEVLLLVFLFILFFILTLLGIKLEGLEKVIFWVLTIIYNSIFIYKSGATIGKKLLKLRVVNSEYKPVSLKQALLRESLGKFYSTVIFYLGYLHALKSPQKQTWHDKMAKTYVVSVDSKGNLITLSSEAVSNKDKIIYWILFSIATLPLILSIFVIFYLFIAHPIQIKGRSMLPSYKDGQYYFATPYRLEDLTRDDVIVFSDVNNGVNFDNFKRVIGLPGDRVRISGGKVYLNGQQLNESAYLDQSVLTGPSSFLGEDQEVTVPENSYFVLGDNRPYSSDSRTIGFVSKEKILSKVSFCYWNCSQKKLN